MISLSEQEFYELKFNLECHLLVNFSKVFHMWGTFIKALFSFPVD